MSTLRYEQKRIMIWGTTYPELSEKYYETVCCGGVTEAGQPVRLYPVPKRYRPDTCGFRKYQWITAAIARDTSDPRPESHKVDPDSIQLGDIVPPDKDEWYARWSILSKSASWLHESVDALWEAQERESRSLGLVAPREIQRVHVVRRPDDEAATFEEKFSKIQRKVQHDRSQLRMFDAPIPDELRELTYLPTRIEVDWHCGNLDCNGHGMQILDWEVTELQRREGDEKALVAVRERCDLTRYATRFFLGNLRQHPTSFMIVGLWYPKRRAADLFSAVGDN